MADNFGIKLAVENEKQFKNALRDINRTFKVLGSELSLVTEEFKDNDKSIEALTASNKTLISQIDAQKNKVSTLEKALNNASDSFGKTDKRTQNWQIQLNKAKADLIKMERSLKENNRALDDVGDGFNKVENEVTNFADEIEKAVDKTDDAGNRFSKLGSVIKGAGAAIGVTIVGIGTAVVATSASLIKLGDEYNNAVNHISASTGATGTELEELGSVAQKVYKHNFGDSLTDVSEGISQVKKITGLMGDELEKATESGFALRDTFDFDMQESARAAGALMKNFGISAEDAYSIIAVGAQNGANQNGDLLDILNEYSTQYKSLGLGADEFVNGLIKGAESGVFSIDKVGDAVKEFNIRAKDESKNSMEAFSALGLNAEDMTRKFANAGNTANEAFYEVINRLNELEDPLIKNTVGVQLFGTQFEDLETNVLPVLASMKDSTLANADALSQIKAIKYNNLSDGFEGIKRSLQGVFLPAVSEVSDGITDLFSELSNGINDAEGDFDKISKVIGETVGSIAEIITEQFPKFITLGLDIITAIFSAIVDNLPMIIEVALQIVMTLINSILDALPQITEGALQMVLTLVDGILDNLPVIVEAALMMIITLATGIGDALPELVPAIIDTIIMIVDVIINNLDLILDVAFKIIEGLATGIINALPKLMNAIPKIIISIVEFITSSLPKLLELGIKLNLQLAMGLIKAIPQLIRQLPQIVTAIIKSLGQAAYSIVGIGKNIVSGLWNGIASMITWIKKKISNFVGGIVSDVKGVLGIKSPSRVFAGIGENMGEGIGVGFTDTMRDVEKDMAESIPTEFELDLNSQITANKGSIGTQIFDLTIPLTIDGTLLTKVIAQLQWNKNTVTVRNLGIVSH